LFVILWWMYLFQNKGTESWTEKKNIYSYFYKRHHRAFLNASFVPEAKLLLFFNPVALILARTVTVVTSTLLLHHYIWHTVFGQWILASLNIFLFINSDFPCLVINSFLFINSDFPCVVITSECNIQCSLVWFIIFFYKVRFSMSCNKQFSFY